jgi:hypothetical protein
MASVCERGSERVVMSDQKCRQNGRQAGSLGRYLFSGLGTWDFGFFPFAFAGWFGLRDYGLPKGVSA